MRRLHLIELHEQSWYPDAWRRLFQLSLGRGISMLGIFENMAEPFQRLLHSTQPRSILDLCTGSGEVAVSFWNVATSKLEGDQRPTLFLSDLYPNVPSYSSLKKQNPGSIDFYTDPVDALNPPPDVPRVWMLIEGLHHFRPHQAREILRSATEKADGFIAFESTDRNWRFLLQVILVAPWFTAFVTSFMLRPFRFTHFLWGLLIPIIPLTTVFDGIVSNLRTHTTNELKAMTESIGCPGFTWEVGSVVAPKSGGLKINYLVGWREQ